ncbi:MAG: hypothetical protein ACLPXT_05555 [Terracidiphilus sp.]
MHKQVPVFSRFSELALIAVLAAAVPAANAQLPPGNSRPAPTHTPTVTQPPPANHSAAPGHAPVVIQPPPAEIGALQQHSAVKGAISHSYPMRQIDGTLNLTMDPDGNWTFSGSSSKGFPGQEIDITLALKDTQNQVILFQYKGDASHGVHFSKHGTNPILKEHFQSFAASHQSTFAYRFYESSEGQAQAYEARQRAKQQLTQEIQQARQRHDDRTATAKAAELRNVEQQEIENECKQSASRTQTASHGMGAPIKGSNGAGNLLNPPIPTIGGGGNPVTSAVATVSRALDSTVGTALNTVGSVAKSVLSFL